MEATSAPTVKAKGTGDAATTIVKAHHFYINIVLLNKDEALKGKVQDKAG